MIEPSARPDLLVFHRSPFVRAKANAKPTAPSPRGPSQQRLARVSGRTGRTVWDIPLEDQPSQVQPGNPSSTHELGDLDGDGSLDAAIVVPRPGQAGQADYELKVISLHDGLSRWSRLLRYQGFMWGSPSIEIAKGPPKEPATLFVSELPATSASNELRGARARRPRWS